MEDGINMTKFAKQAITLVILIMMGIFIGGTFESATPDLADDSQWNGSYNTDLIEPATTLNDIFTLIAGIFVLVVLLAVAKYYGWI